ncbi:peptidoglycan/LPS O-acetylase OafA/YrhL [Pontibacter aydingkolensis]|uniref:Acyltransferase n=1 Tax=Pontibacter aydingkolensis TaxID=1911536 RepID=A0ABS7CW50_9BACT|nr:acyltransferase [Pontibacter aydingkolensis]MBW7468015.1 acyltransferase [Pontibacter aydingkolensis]
MNRLLFLDSLRGLAALAVALFHYTSAYRSYFGHSFSESFDFDYGLYGVELFFMISGFVIFFSFDRIKSSKEFLFNRAIRLYPAYWFCLIITFFAVHSFGLNELETSIPEMLVNLTMFQKLFGVKDVDGVYWSLFAEWMFYLMMLVLFVTKSLNRILYIGILWVTLGLINQFLFSFGPAATILNLHYGLFFYAGILFFLYLKAPENRKVIQGHLLFTCLAAIAMYMPKGGVQVAVITSFFVLFYLGINGKLDFLTNKVLLLLGSISYTFYLFHQYIGYIIIDQTKEFFGSSLFIIVPPLVFSLAASYAITIYIEQPIVKFMKSWYKAKQGTPVVYGEKTIASGFASNKSTPSS